MSNKLPRPMGIIKQHHDDFFVAEQLDFTLTGAGEHLWCYVEKTDLNTAYLKRQWAKLVDCQVKEISHSGLKDRHARTQQWLCLPAKYSAKLPDSGEGWQILQRQAHQKKLRIGSHKRNDFKIVVREITGAQDDIEASLEKVKAQGFANYFGAQRFGRRNLEQATAWVERGRLPKKRAERAQVLSTLRAYLFNIQLDARRANASHQRLLLGDRAGLTGSKSFFLVSELDDTLQQRLDSGDIVPCGWLVGQATPDYQTPSGELIAKALAPYADMVAYLQDHMQSDWRALSVRAQDLNWQWHDANTLALSFSLPSGSYATALLAELMTINDASTRHDYTIGVTSA